MAQDRQITKGQSYQQYKTFDQDYTMVVVITLIYIVSALMQRVYIQIQSAN